VLDCTQSNIRSKTKEAAVVNKQKFQMPKTFEIPNYRTCCEKDYSKLSDIKFPPTAAQQQYYFEKSAQGGWEVNLAEKCPIDIDHLSLGL
jgi:hypothetical protein